MLAEAGRLQRLIGDLLDLARLETRRFSLNVEEVDLCDVCESAAGAQREEARAHHLHLHVHAEAKPVVVGDGDRILQIVTNLVTNALHATPAGGEVAVDVAIADGAGQVVVSDTGPGIPEERRAVNPASVRDGRRPPRRRARTPGGLGARAGDGRDARRSASAPGAARRSRSACRSRRAVPPAARTAGATRTPSS